MEKLKEKFGKLNTKFTEKVMGNGASHYANQVIYL